MILAIGSVENRNFEKQIAKQTVQPDHVAFWVDDYPATGMENRRKRIAENHKQLVKIVELYQPDFVWQIEGDGDLPEDALERLIADYKELESDDLGYITGIELGRHGIYAIGAWHVAEDGESFKSLDHTATGIVEIDASGFYCLFAKADTWLNGNCYWDGERWGPDVNWGLSLRKQGYKIYADTNIKLGHITERGKITFDNINVCTVEFTKGKDKWTYKTRQ